VVASLFAENRVPLFHAMLWAIGHDPGKGNAAMDRRGELLNGWTVGR
jgi:hypothetical protein